MLTAYCWNPETKTCDMLSGAKLEADAADLRGEPYILWVDLENPTAEEEALVFDKFFKVHPLTREDITRLRRATDARAHFPKVEEFPDYLFVVVNPLSQELLLAMQGNADRPADFEAQASTQLSVILTDNLLITHHYEPAQSTADLRAYLNRHQLQAGRGPDYLFHLILDTMVDEYALVLDHFDDLLDAIEVQVFDRPRPTLLQDILRAKREIIALRKTLVYEREVLARLCRGEFRLIDEREAAYYRNVYDHLVRFTELTESSREMVTDLMQTHLAATSNRLSEVMKALTTISTIVLPMTLITGIYGMNFDHMPETKWPLGYPMALGIMALFGLSSYVFFRWRSWV